MNLKSDGVQKEVSTYVLPHIKGEYTPGVAMFWEYFSSGRVERNVEMINTVLNEAYEGVKYGYLEHTNELLNKVHTLAIYRRLYWDYADRLPLFSQAVAFGESLSQTIENVHTSDIQEMSIHEMTEHIKQILLSSSQDIIFVSDSHASLFSEVEAIHILGIDYIGAFVFDTHHEFQETEEELGENEEISLEEKPRVNKTNVLKALLDKGYICGVSIVGLPRYEAKTIERGSRTETEDDPIFNIYREYSDRISMVDESRYTKPYPYMAFNKTAFYKAIEEQVYFLKNANAKHIIISLDLDVLRSDLMGYTVMEYSRLAYIALLAIYDFGKLSYLLEDFQSTHTSESLLTLIDLMVNALTAEGESSLLADNLVVTDSIKEVIATLAKVGKDRHSGLSLGAVGSAIDIIKAVCAREGISYGVILTDGGRYLGNITEAAAPDYANRTARAMGRYIKRNAK